MGHGSRPNQKILALAESDDPGCGKEFNPSLCRMRHMAARLREERGQRHEYEPCCHCPRVINHIRKEKGDDYMKIIIKNKEETPSDGRMPCKTCGTIAKVGENGQCLPCQEVVKSSAAGQRPEGFCRCGRKLSVNGHCFSCAMKGKKHRQKKQAEAARCNGCGTTEDVRLTPKGPMCCACYMNEPAPRTVEVKPREAFEPAADAIHASQPHEKELREMSASEACKLAGIQSCYNCDDLSCGDNLSATQKAKLQKFIGEKKFDLTELNRQARQQESLLNLKYFEINNLERFLQDLEQAVK